MSAGHLLIDLPDGATLIVVSPDLGDAQAQAETRRELRLWARAGEAPFDEAVRSLDIDSAQQVAETLGELIAAGVIGNAAWAAFPRTAALLERIMRRRTIHSAAELATRLRDVLAAGPTPFASFELLEATRADAGGWIAVVRLDDRTVAVATDPSGDIVTWKRVDQSS